MAAIITQRCQVLMPSATNVQERQVSHGKNLYTLVVTSGCALQVRLQNRVPGMTVKGLKNDCLKAVSGHGGGFFLKREGEKAF